MKHEFTLSRVVKLGSAIGTDREWATVSAPEEAVQLYRQGWEFADGFCNGPCPVCDKIMKDIEE